MAWTQAPSHPFQLSGLVAGTTVHLRLRAAGTTPAGYEATAIMPAGPNTATGAIVSWPQLNQSTAYADGSVVGNAGAGSSWAQGTPLLQNSGAGLRGSISASVNGAAGENRIGWKSTVYSGSDTMLARNLEYCFATNGYDWLALLEGSIKASGTMQAGQRVYVNIYDSRVDYLVSDQLVYSEPGAVPQSVYYPAAFFGGAGGSRFHEVRVVGNLARPMVLQDIEFGPTWSVVTGFRYQGTSQGAYQNTVRIRFAAGIRLQLQQGQGFNYIITNSAGVVVKQTTEYPAAISYEVKGLSGTGNYIDVTLEGTSVQIDFDPQYSVLYF